MAFRAVLGGIVNIDGSCQCRNLEFGLLGYCLGGERTFFAEAEFLIAGIQGTSGDKQGDDDNAGSEFFHESVYDCQLCHMVVWFVHRYLFIAHTGCKINKKEGFLNWLKRYGAFLHRSA